MRTREENRRRGNEREVRESNPSLREPIVQSHMLVTPQEPQVGDEGPTDSIDEVVSRLIIHEDRPIENLPTMTAPELKLIGRCVSFRTKQTINGVTAQYFYTGLVSAVNSTAVTLMYVNRYTEDDFKIYKEREKTVLRTVNASDQEMARRNRRNGQSLSSAAHNDQHPGGAPLRGNSAEEDVVAGGATGLTRQQNSEVLLQFDAAGSLAPAVKMAFEVEGEEKAFSSTPEDEMGEGGNEGLHGGRDGATRALRPPYFRSCATSIGPLPCVSFLRKSIHDVAFGRDPRSSFYSLFEDPSKKLMDMQYLRMFVRRYLVHTSEGNNPRQVPIYSFVTVRGACPDLDYELVSQLVREELPGLMKADCAIEKEKKRQHHREIRQEQAIREYRAPPGLFSKTGILYLTNTPQSTFISAVVTMFFTIIFAVFLAVTRAVTADPLIDAYLSQIIRYLIASLCVWIVAGVSIGLHAVHMHIPLRDDRWLLVSRAVLTLGALVCVIMSLVTLLGRMTNQRLYDFIAFRSGGLLCEFYIHYQCSGFTTSCVDLNYVDPNLCLSCSQIVFSPTICYYELWSQLQIIIIPLLVFCVFVLLALALSIFQFVKLWLMARALGDQVNS